MQSSHDLVVHQLGVTDYKDTLNKMQAFTFNRNETTPDELWVTEHPPVYTLGLNRKNVRMPNNHIPVELVDRGGKITYHGPGQIVIYTLIDLKRKRINIRELVSILENSIITVLAKQQIDAVAKKDAPGVYVNNKKIASLGLRIKQECCYHGLSLNVDMDMSPFQAIDPCGYVGLEVTQTKDLGIAQTLPEISDELIHQLKEKLNAWQI